MCFQDCLSQSLAVSLCFFLDLHLGAAEKHFFARHRPFFPNVLSRMMVVGQQQYHHDTMWPSTVLENKISHHTNVVSIQFSPMLKRVPHVCTSIYIKLLKSEVIQRLKTSKLNEYIASHSARQPHLPLPIVLVHSIALVNLSWMSNHAVEGLGVKPH